MNPLTQVKNIQKATAREHAEGISEQGSWHERFKDSAYINIGLLPFDVNEGDLLAIFAQYVFAFLSLQCMSSSASTYLLVQFLAYFSLLEIVLP
jgi:hypothetical protein